MPSPPCLQFHREYAPPTTLAVGLEEPQEGLTGSQLRSRGGEEIHAEPPLCLRSTLGIGREDRSQAAQVLGGHVLRQIVATVYVVRAILVRHKATVQVHPHHPGGHHQLQGPSSPSSNSLLLRLQPIFSLSSSRSVSWTPDGSSPSSVNCGITRLSIQHLCCRGVALRSRNVTATVLQPGRYGSARDGRAAVANLVKHLQNGVILGRSRTGLVALAWRRSRVRVSSGPLRKTSVLQDIATSQES